MSAIFYVDDKPEQLLEGLALEDRALFSTYNPSPEDGDAAEQKSKFEEALVEAPKADLWVFDFFLGSHELDADTAAEENGLSIFQKFRRFAQAKRPLTALISNDLNIALGGAFPSGRAHIAAEKAGVEWVGSKADFEPIRQLRDAAATVRERAAAAHASQDHNEATKLPNSSGAICFQILVASAEVAWSQTAERHVDRARPPQLLKLEPERAASREILGWLLHRVLPYPSFLLTCAQAAVKLGVTTESFKSIVAAQPQSDLAQAIKACAYTGPLHKFCGDRWWRAGIEDLVWSASQNVEGFQAIISKMVSPIVPTFLMQSDPVVVSDPDLVETDEIADASECVRAQDEYFPPDVPAAWVKRTSAAEDKVLAAKVIFEDRHLLVPEEA